LVPVHIARLGSRGNAPQNHSRCPRSTHSGSRARKTEAPANHNLFGESAPDRASQPFHFCHPSESSETPLSSIPTRRAPTSIHAAAPRPWQPLRRFAGSQPGRLTLPPRRPVLALTPPGWPSPSALLVSLPASCEKQPPATHHTPSDLFASSAGKCAFSASARFPAHSECRTKRHQRGSRAGLVPGRPSWL